jgi:KDO2-lipid IV(A) lauroyltransferase
MKWLTRLFSKLPHSIIRYLGRPFGFLWFDLFRFRRSIVLNNLKRAFPDWSHSQRVRVGRRSVYHMTENFFEFFMFPNINSEWIKNHVQFEGEEELKAAYQLDKGVLLLSLHLGNGDLMANVIASLKYPVFIITKFFKSKWLNDFWFSVRGAQGVKYIEPHGEKAPFAILKALKTKAVVAFVLDQHMGRPFGVRNTFFGHPVGTAYGLALFYLKTKAPVVLIYNFIDQQGKYHIVSRRIEGLEVFLQNTESDREQTLVRLTQLFTDRIEEVVRQYPEQWMWVHRRWKWKGP